MYEPPYRGPPPPEEPWPPETVTEVTEVYEGPPAGPPSSRPPLWNSIWFWLALLGLVAVVIVLIAILASRDDERGRPTVPQVVGLRQAVALDVLEEAGYDANTSRTASDEPRGIVVDQDPDAGTRLRRNQTVQIVVSRGPETVTTVQTVTESVEVVVVPDVVGDHHAPAGATIDGIDLIADSFPVESGEPRGTVIGQDPAGGSEVPPGTHVLLSVALGPGERPTGTVPDVTGPNEVEARAALRQYGLTVRTIDRPAPTPEERGEVILQRPAAGTEVPVLAQIRIFVGR